MGTFDAHRGRAADRAIADEGADQRHLRAGTVGHGDPNPRSGVAPPGDGDGQPIFGEPPGRERGGHRRARVGIDGGGARGLAGRVGDEHQIASQQPDLEDHEQEHDEEREEQRHLHGGLAPVGEPPRAAGS